MKAKVDRDLCMGIGNCVAVAPTVFQLDAEHKAPVLDVPSVSDDNLISAAESCPLNAITIEDEQGQQVSP